MDHDSTLAANLTHLKREKSPKFHSHLLSPDFTMVENSGCDINPIFYFRLVQGIGVSNGLLSL